MKHSRLLFLSALLLCGANLKAQVPEHYLVVEETDGTCTQFNLRTRPHITIIDDVVGISTPGDTLKFQAATVARAYLVQRDLMPSTYDPSGIASAEKQMGKVAILKDEVKLNGFEPGSPVTIYTADGRQILNSKVQADGNLTLPIAERQNGIFIVKINKQSFKLIRK